MFKWFTNLFRRRPADEYLRKALEMINTKTTFRVSSTSQLCLAINQLVRDNAELDAVERMVGEYRYGYDAADLPQWTEESVTALVRTIVDEHANFVDAFGVLLTTSPFSDKLCCRCGKFKNSPWCDCSPGKKKL